MVSLFKLMDKKLCTIIRSEKCLLFQVVDLLLRSNLCSPLLIDSPSDLADNNKTTCLHLAAKNGHLDILR